MKGREMEIAIFRTYRKHHSFNEFMGYSGVHHLMPRTALSLLILTALKG